MRALIFAAGLGTRMRPLSEHTPKPLLPVAGKPLIVWHLEKLAAHGIRQVVINTAHLGAQFPTVLGDGTRWNLHIRYAHEGDAPLQTGGGLLHALPWLGHAPFLVINGDIWTDFDLSRLRNVLRGNAQLVMVDNPAHHPHGDFRLDTKGHLHDDGSPRLTFAGLGMYRPELLDNWHAVIGDNPGASLQPPCFPLTPLLRAAMHEGRVDGLYHGGRWTDVGTPQRLRELDDTLR